MRKKLFLALIATLMLPMLAYTQQHQAQTVRGTVVDASTGDPIIGATITVLNTSLGTITDVDGRFSLNVSAIPVNLTIGFLGYTSQSVVVSQVNTPINIKLAESTQVLDEVVVTALGISREKKSLGYATQSVKGDDLNGNASTNIINALAGKAAGVRITNAQGDIGASRIIIRGETSIAGNNQPLFVVDGVPVDNSQLMPASGRDQSRDFRNAIADLNPDDIASINVLKGPNAAALYGSRAAHGVVIITTKKGTRQQRGFGVNVTAGWSFSQVATLPEFQNEFGQGANGEFSYVNGKGGGVNDGVDESWGPRLDGRLLPQFDSPIVNGVRQPTPWIAHPNNVRDFFQTGVTQDYGVSIANADDKFDYRLGAHYQDQTSTVPNTEIKKTNFSFSGDYKLHSRVKVGANMNYILTDAPNVPSGGSPTGSNYRGSSVMLQFLWFGRQVNMQSLKELYPQGISWNSNYYDNPYWACFYNTTEQQRHRIIGDIHADIKITNDLNFRFRSGTDYYNDLRMYKIKTGSSASGAPDGSYAEDRYELSEDNTEALLSYIHRFSDWSVDGLAGFNMRNTSYRNNWQKATKLAAPDLYTLSNSKDPLESSNLVQRRRVYSAFFSAQVGYHSWAFLNVTGRNDWSSTLPATHRSFFYPSVTASVIVSDALGIQSSNLSYLKVRAGWAEVGNDADPYQLATTYNIAQAFMGNPIQTSSTTKNNALIKPERTQSTEAGLEAGFLDNRLTLDLAWYYTRSVDQILTIQTSAASGFSNQLINAGEISNTGVEVQLGATPVKARDFSWQINVNYAANRSKVIKLDGHMQTYVLGTAGPQVVATVGERYGALFGGAYQRDNAGNILVGDNGLPLKQSTNQILGYFTPDWTGAITNSFSYKNFSLSALIDASFGASLYSSSAATGTRTGVYANTVFGRSAEFGGLNWTDEKGNARDDGMIFEGVNATTGQPNTKIISAESYYNASNGVHEKYTFDASYIKLREIRLSYTFNKSLIQKWGIQGLTLSAFGRNIAILYRDKNLNMDPEVGLNTGNVQGVEALTRPTSRTFGLNINLQF